MKRVIFDIQKNGNRMIYPDNISLFARTDIETIPGKIIADYFGDLDLEEYAPEAVSEPVILTLRQFRNRFTFAEKVAIKVSTDPGVLVVQDDLVAAQYIDLSDQGLADGMTYLVSQGLITEERKNEILT